MRGSTFYCVYNPQIDKYLGLISSDVEPNRLYSWSEVSQLEDSTNSISLLLVRTTEDTDLDHSARVTIDMLLNDEKRLMEPLMKSVFIEVSHTDTIQVFEYHHQNPIYNVLDHYDWF